MSRINSIVERVLWLGVIGGAVFFWRHGSAFLDAASALSAGESLAALRGGDSPLGAHWGAWLFEWMGVGPDSARAIGGLPAWATYLLVLSWTWLRWGWKCALCAAVLAWSATPWAAYFYTASRWPLFSLALALSAVSAFELQWRARTGWHRPLLWVSLALGLFGASAAIGVPGVALWLGVVGSLLLAFLFSERAFWKIFFASFLTWPLLVASVAPFALSGWQLAREQGWPAALVATFQNFVGAHPDWVADGGAVRVEWNPAAAWQAWLRESLVWAWIPALAWVACLVMPRKLNKNYLAAWGFNAIAFGGALGLAAGFLPFDEGRALLRGAVPLTWPLLGAGVAWLLERIGASAWTPRQELRARWACAALLAAAVALASLAADKAVYPVTAFAAIAPRVARLPEDCALWVAPGAVGELELKGFVAWYLGGRVYEVAPRELPSRIAVPAGKAYWDPGRGLLWGQGKCEP